MHLRKNITDTAGMIRTAGFKKIFLCSRKKSFYFSLLFLTAVLTAGLCTYSDYGLSWDELAERRSGIVSAGNILLLKSQGRALSGQEQHAMIGGDRFYGMAFQHILLAAEYLKSGGINRNMHLPHELWMLRHLINFCFVWCGLLALFFSGKMLWKNNFAALTPVLLFLLIPRFWAESFFNCKDMPLLAGFCISGYCLLRMIKNPSTLRCAVFAVSAAFVSAIRLSGGIMFAAGFITLVLCNEIDCQKRIILLLKMLFFAASALILFYPACWSDPVFFFPDAISYMANHPWNGSVLFCGREYLASDTPAYYLPVWMLITLPVPLLLLFICGHWQTRRAESRFHRRSRILFLLLFYISFGVVMLFCRTFYNGWRQFYFLAYPLIMIASEGVVNIHKYSGKRKLTGTLLKIAGTIWILSTVVWMIYAHPYQNMFFNILAGNPGKKFELDYWHTSEKEALEYIASAAKKENSRVSVALNTTNYFSRDMLAPAYRERIHIVPQEDFSQYYLFFARPQWSMDDPGRPFKVDFSTDVRCIKEFNIRTSLFLYPVFLCRIYQFSIRDTAD